MVVEYLSLKSAYWAHKEVKWKFGTRLYLFKDLKKICKIEDIYPLLYILANIPGLGSFESVIKVKADKKWGCENDNIEFAPSNSFSLGQGNVVSQDQSSVFAANSILLCQAL